MAIPQGKQRRYSYRDVLGWPEGERWELIEGVPCNMSPALSRLHQEVVGEVFRQISNFLLEHPCWAYVAPFDVRLAESYERDDAVWTVVQPDVLVVCDPDKLDERGCQGAPDLIVEVLSPATAARDQIEKARLYEHHGVREYWVIHPVDRIVSVQVRGEEGRWEGWRLYEASESLDVSIFPGLQLDLSRVLGRKDTPPAAPGEER